MLAGPVAGAISGFINNDRVGQSCPANFNRMRYQHRNWDYTDVLYATAVQRDEYLLRYIASLIVSAKTNATRGVIFWGGRDPVNAWVDSSLFAVMVANHNQCGYLIYR